MAQSASDFAMDASCRSVSMPRVAAASFAGAVLEWYDFFLFGTASALVFGPLFFPGINKAASTGAALATFGVGFIARPLGGIFFGHLGDKLGRKVTLIATLLIVGTGTFLIGLLPTYARIGIWAPITLVILRLVQGFGLGGEYGGAALLTIEHAVPNRRGFWGSLPQASAATGLLLGTGIFDLMSRLPKDEFLDWGWRIPFLLSVVMLVIGLFIRLNILETPDFERTRQTHKVARLPLFVLLAQHPMNTLWATGARLAETVSFNIIAVFGIAYLTNVVGVPRWVPLTGIMISSAVAIPLCPLFGLLSDRWGRRTLYLVGCICSLLLAFPFFALLDTGSPTLIVIAMVIIYSLAPTLMFSVETTFFTELFSTNVRYTGLSVAYQFSAIIGGFVPLVALNLLAANDKSPWLVAAFLVAISGFSFLSAYLANQVDTE
ncbi:MAG: MHS family MFS transporter [Pseudomonadota bacterium]|nr:MHS family MFS transporter [Pseudomonadota bacterium]